MILIDDRAGSGELAEYVPGSILCRLEFGDVCLNGNGPRGNVLIGVEIKTVGDALSCITTGRFAGHQLPGMLHAYDYNWLVLQGVYRACPETGILQTAKAGAWEDLSIANRCYMARDLEAWVISMEMQGGLRSRTTRDWKDTARFVRHLHHWWNHKSYHEHRSVKVWDQSGNPTLADRSSLVRRVAKELPGVGWERSALIEGRFRCVADMVSADEKTWQEVPGIGKILSSKIFRGLHGLEEFHKKGGTV